MDQIKILASSKAASANSYCDTSSRVLRKHKSNNGILLESKQQANKNPKNIGKPHYCVLLNKAGVPDHNWKSKNSKNYFGKRSNQVSVKVGLRGTLGNRSAAVQQYHKSEKKCKRGLKALKKQNKMLFSMSKLFGSRREFKKIKNICVKKYKKHDYSSSNSSISDSDLSLYRHSY